jgi:hypothetical protein
MRAVSHDWIEMEIRQPAARWEKASAPQEDWRNLIRAASQEEEVIELVRDHIALWSPEEIARLPEDCRPPRIRDAEDISRWAFELATSHCAQKVHSDDEVLLDRLLEFVTHAAVRLSELKAELPQDIA